jgi:hypothetical protein
LEDVHGDDVLDLTDSSSFATTHGDINVVGFGSIINDISKEDFAAIDEILSPRSVEDEKESAGGKKEEEKTLIAGKSPEQLKYEKNIKRYCDSKTYVIPNGEYNGRNGIPLSYGNESILRNADGSCYIDSVFELLFISVLPHVADMIFDNPDAIRKGNNMYDIILLETYNLYHVDTREVHSHALFIIRQFVWGKRL